MRVLGPTRKETQVEIAMTEQFKLGVQPPIRQSGDLTGTPGLTLEGPHGSTLIERGVICAQRHIHMSPDDALRFRVRDNTVVRVRIAGNANSFSVTRRPRESSVPPGHAHRHRQGNAGNIHTGMLGYIKAREPAVIEPDTARARRAQTEPV